MTTTDKQYLQQVYSRKERENYGPAAALNGWPSVPLLLDTVQFQAGNTPP